MGDFDEDLEEDGRGGAHGGHGDEHDGHAGRPFFRDHHVRHGAHSVGVLADGIHTGHVVHHALHGDGGAHGGAHTTAHGHLAEEPSAITVRAPSTSTPSSTAPTTTAPTTTGPTPAATPAPAPATPVVERPPLVEPSTPGMSEYADGVRAGVEANEESIRAMRAARAVEAEAAAARTASTATEATEAATAARATTTAAEAAEGASAAGAASHLTPVGRGLGVLGAIGGGFQIDQGIEEWGNGDEGNAVMDVGAGTLAVGGGLAATGLLGAGAAATAALPPVAIGIAAAGLMSAGEHRIQDTGYWGRNEANEGLSTREMIVRESEEAYDWAHDGSVDTVGETGATILGGLAYGGDAIVNGIAGGAVELGQGVVSVAEGIGSIGSSIGSFFGFGDEEEAEAHH